MESKADKVRVTLAKPHTHAGKAYPAGAQLDVKVALLPWLQERGIVAAPAPGDSAVKAP